MKGTLRALLGAFAAWVLLASATAGAGPRAPVGAGAAQAGPALVTRCRMILDQALTARNPDTRKLAVQALGLIGPREPYLSRLMVMVNDRDVQVRMAAIASLLDLHDPAALPAIRHAYDDPVPEVSFAAARALQALGDPVGRQALIAVLGGGDDAASGYLAHNTRSMARMFYTPKSLIPYLTARAIGMAHVAGLGAGVASLQGLLADQNLSARASAALLLGQDKDPRVLPALRAALRDKGADVRAAAVHALALRDDPALQPDLLALLDDRDGAVRIRAAAACLRLELIARHAIRPVATGPTSRAMRAGPGGPAAH